MPLTAYRIPSAHVTVPACGRGAALHGGFLSALWHGALAHRVAWSTSVPQRLEGS